LSHRKPTKLPYLNLPKYRNFLKYYKKRKHQTGKTKRYGFIGLLKRKII